MTPREELEYDTKMSVSYHHKREHFYRAVDAAGKAFSLVALAAVGFHTNLLTIIVAVLSGSFTIATVVLDCAGMAARHNGLAARFSTLLSKTAEAADESISSLRRDYHIIEADEPPLLRGLVQICQDELDAAMGRAVDASRFSFWRRVAAQFGFGDREINWT